LILVQIPLGANYECGSDIPSKRQRTGRVSKGERHPGAPQHELISELGTKHWLDLGAVYHDLPLRLGTA
jgi:hypothetical protein